VRCLRHENGNLKKNALSKIKSHCRADSKNILEQKSAEYFLRKTHFKFTTFEFAPLWSGGGAALFTILKSPANGGGGRGGGDLLSRRSPPLAEVIMARPPFFLSLPGSPADWPHASG
jgi:hypothetical protein